MNRRTFALIGLLLCSTAYAAGTSIWNATDRGTVAATDRLPVATSSSSGPLYVTPLTLQSYLLSGSATTEVLANNAGAFDGDSGFTFNATNNTVDLGGATITASDPVLDLSQTWNSGATTFTGFKLNVTSTASAAASNFADFQVAGSSVLGLQKNGTIKMNGSWLYSSGGGAFKAGNGQDSSADGSFVAGRFVTGGNTIAIDDLGFSGIGLASTYSIFWSSTGAWSGTADLYLRRDAANTLAQRNSTTAQTFRVYDTYTDSSNYGRLALNTSLTGDWVQVAAETAGTAGDNYGIALTPTGTGAISAHVPDSGTAGGNARGANAVDWVNAARGAATMVASGQYSTISGGGNNTASGANSSVGGGITNAATGVSSRVGGGSSNTASITVATVSGGMGNTASGDGATVAGGYTNTASGGTSWVPGGIEGTTRGLFGAYAYSSGKRSALGDAQVIGQPVRRTTTDATPVSLATDGTPAATTVMVLPASSTLMCTAMVVAQSASAANNAGYQVLAVIQRDGSSNTALVGTATTTTVGEDTAGMDATIIANDTLESAEIQVTGVAATTIQWMGELKCVQVL